MNKNLNKNTFYSIIKSCSTILFPILTFPYISRVLLTENVGKINFSNSIVSYFSLIASLGITTYAVRECSKIKSSLSDLEKLSSELISINTVTMLISYILLFFTLIFADNLKDYRSIILIQSLSIIFTTYGADWINTVMEDFKYVTLRTFSFQLFSLILMFIFIKKPDDYVKYVIITLIASSGGNIVNIFYRKRYCKIKFTLNMNMRKHLPGIITLFAMILAQQIFVNSDTTIIGLINGDQEVGLYTTGVKIYSIVSTFMSSIAWVVMPRLSSSFKNRDYKTVNETIAYVVGFTSTIGFPIVVGMFLLAPEIIGFIAGSSYIDAVPALRVLSIALLFSLGWGILMNMILLPEGKDSICLFSCSICACVNLVLNFVLIPTFGFVAAAWTTAISQVIGLIICYRKIDKKIKLKVKNNDLIGIISGCIIICLTILIIRKFFSNDIITLIVSVTSSIFLYLIIQILFKNSWIKYILSSIRRGGN